jgi:hypothetical protein
MKSRSCVLNQRSGFSWWVTHFRATFKVLTVQYAETTTTGYDNQIVGWSDGVVNIGGMLTGSRILCTITGLHIYL